MRSAFTLIELIFVIVIIGVLAAVAVPKFSGLSGNAKVASELATASTVQAAIDDAHSEWIMSEGSFKWGSGQTTNCNTSPSPTNFDCTSGYPTELNSSDVFGLILKKTPPDWEQVSGKNNTFRGPASKSDSGVNKNKANKPDSGECWKDDSSKGSFKLEEDSGSC